MDRIPLTDNDRIRVLGRTSPRRDPLTLFWTGAGIEMRATGRELYVDLIVDFENHEPWIEIEIDGALNQRRMLDRGKQTVCLFRGMDPGPVRHVRLIKSTQAPSQDEKSLLQIEAVVTDGELLPIEPPRCRIEVIGDSLTSGEGLNGAVCENSWNSSVFGVTGSYHDLLAKALGAETHIISQSGFGVYCSWCGIPAESIPRYYEQVCGPLTGPRNAELGALDRWDFASWQPDVIIVNLGTNDAGSFAQAGKEFPERNWRCPMRVEADGRMNEDDRRLVLNAAIDFLTMLRRDNPHSYIVWGYGLIPGIMEATLREAVDTYASRSGDQRAELFMLPAAREGEMGSRNHPGPIAHKRAAEALTERVRAILDM